ncbi:MAG: putative DNA alkylation repair enzyme [Nitrospira sp.]|jgi:3-methyladenine DNA glycosylase AlkC|nr:MAG: putative DNA alkylation repair enzyme [Nitrospira sp.]
MAEPLKNQFGADIPRTIARMIAAVFPGFDQKAFVRSSLEGYDGLELMPRGWKIARTLRRYLPDDYEKAVEILLSSLDQTPKRPAGLGTMAPFLFLPHVLFVAEYGLEHFEPSMRAQYLLTQRFTAEFSIRRYLERHPSATMARLRTWAVDPSADVRRLVSEGTRPRLPWAPRLRAFQADPRPVLALLELLKDDPALYVRRSVANNLNDIGKDHPALLVETARRWMVDATEERRWIIRHALRSAVKRGESEALAVLGFGRSAPVSIRKVRLTPPRAAIGASITIACELVNEASTAQRLLIDLRVQYVKANGRPSPKVFKLKVCEVVPKETVQVKKMLSLAQRTTRTHYPGSHPIELMVNGRAHPLGTFDLVEK